tara:strand:+ start:7518 stop:8159 length:642 start_codon:yes stop_codon:yes gene_type:complete
VTGIEAGKTWSRVGPEVAPTSSSASGVWTLQEYSENKGAGTWPNPYEAGYNFLGTVAASSGTLLTFTNIPQDAQDLMILLYSRTAGNSTTVSFIPNATTIGATAAPGGYVYNNGGGFSTGRKTNATTYATQIYDKGWNAVVTVYNYSSTTAAKGLFYHGGSTSQQNSSSFSEWAYANYATLGSAAVTSFSILHNNQDMQSGTFASVFGIGAKI